MTFNNTQPIFSPAMHYRIEVKGRVDVKWLESFDSSAEISADEDSQKEGITVSTFTPIKRVLSGWRAGYTVWE